MADLALVTANRVNVVESKEQRTLVAGVAITAGQAVQINSTGKWALCDASVVATCRFYGIAVKSVPAGVGVTAIRRGTIDGFNLDALAFDAFVSLSDNAGMLEVAADGTVDVIVGRVVPGTATTLGTAYDKLLEVEQLMLGAGVV